MLVGIIFQTGALCISLPPRAWFTHVATAAMAVFVALAAEFFYRYFKDLPTRPDEYCYSPSRSTGRVPLSRNQKKMTLGLSLTMLFLLIRCVLLSIASKAQWFLTSSSEGSTVSLNSPTDGTARSSLRSGCSVSPKPLAHARSTAS